MFVAINRKSDIASPDKGKSLNSNSASIGEENIATHISDLNDNFCISHYKMEKSDSSGWYAKLIFFVFLAVFCLLATVICVDDTPCQLKIADKGMNSPPIVAPSLETRAKEREQAERECPTKTKGMAGKQKTEIDNTERQIIEARKAELKRLTEERKRSIWQEPQVYIEGLRAKTSWMAVELKISEHIAKIRQNWKLIRNEALAIRQLNLYRPEVENLTDTGKWEIFALYRGGVEVGQNCKRAPFTCNLFDSIPPQAIHPTGSIIFSIMKAGTHVRAHSGPSNTRLRAHLGLQIPEDLSSSMVPSKSYTKLRVAEEYFSWHDGELFIFDDSYDHEVWHDNLEGKPRIILIFDLWHPGLSEEAKNALKPKLRLLASK